MQIVEILTIYRSVVLADVSSAVLKLLCSHVYYIHALNCTHCVHASYYEGSQGILWLSL